MKDLRDKVAVVTGGASGIGLAIAKTLARAGARIALLDLEERAIAPAEASVREVGGDVVGIPADVSSRYSLDAAAQRVLENYGRIDILCNNAGVVVLGALAEASAEDWRWVMGVNLMGAVNGVAAFLPHIRAQGVGHIVNTASTQGLSAAAGLGVYTASKYAVVAYSETLRMELAPEHIGVSVLCPGVVNTKILEAARNRPAELASGASAAPPSALLDALRPAVAHGLDPARVGELVLRGIREDAPYIVTHADTRAAFSARASAIEAAYDALSRS
jgi:NAD(P)-dependent dehydrogenase (short-subunit alcohol dehydrogenase family)